MGSGDLANVQSEPPLPKKPKAQHGEFFGSKATGRAVEVDAIDILRVRDGKLREHWG